MLTNKITNYRGSRESENNKDNCDYMKVSYYPNNKRFIGLYEIN